MNEEPNIADLLRMLRDDTTSLVREEVALAKTELGEKFSKASRNLGFLAVGAFVASSALMMILISLGYLVSEVFIRRDLSPTMSYFLGFLSVALVVGIFSAMQISKSLKSLGMLSMTPRKTVQSLREDKQWAQEKLSS